MIPVHLPSMTRSPASVWVRAEHSASMASRGFRTPLATSPATHDPLILNKDGNAANGLMG